MVKFCALKACPNRDLRNTKDLPVIHHGYPQRPDIASKWGDAINKHNRTTDFKATHRQAAFLCCDHFEESAYRSKRFLNPDAVPTIFPKFTAEVAMKHGLIPSLDSPLLDTLNDFDVSLEGFLKIAAEPAESLNRSKSAVDESLQADTSANDNMMDTDGGAENRGCTPDIHQGTMEGAPTWLSNHSLDHLDAVLQASSDVSNVIETTSTRPALIRVDSFTPERDEGSGLQTAAATNTASTCSNNQTPGPSSSVAPKTPTSVPMSRKRKFHPGDASPSDVASPQRAKVVLNFMKNRIAEGRKDLKAVKMRLKRLLNKVEDMSSLLDHLKEERRISHDAAAMLEVKVKSMKRILMFTDSDEE